MRSPYSWSCQSGDTFFMSKGTKVISWAFLKSIVWICLRFQPQYWGARGCRFESCQPDFQKEALRRTRRRALFFSRRELRHRHPTLGEAELAQIARLCAELAQFASTFVVELDRAVAVAMAFGPQAGLDIVGAPTSEPSLQSAHLLPSVCGDFLVKLGRCCDESRPEFERAASLTHNTRERELPTRSGVLKTWSIRSPNRATTPAPRKPRD